MALSIAVLGYSNSGVIPPWDPEDCSRGLPGSEECVVYGAAELARRGHRVTVYMNPPEGSKWSSPESNPRWVPDQSWLLVSNQSMYHLVLMWRRFDVATGRLRGRVVIFWPHDSPPVQEAYPPFPAFDGVMPLSRHHLNQFSCWAGFAERPMIFAGNGVVLEQFPAAVEKPNPYSMGYFSNYSRGLAILLRMWPAIRRRYPEATLDIYYGREHWGTIAKSDFDRLVEKIVEYGPLGVTERGKVGHLELAAAMQRISVWVYPCIDLGETFCITAVKAQLAGCIPVTTRIGALDETVHPNAPSIPVIKTGPDIQAYAALLMATLDRIQNSDPMVIAAERQMYRDFAPQFSWVCVVDKWVALYEQVAASGTEPGIVSILGLQCDL